MKLAILHTPIGKVITIEIDEILDLTSHGVFEQAGRLAEHGDVNSIVVNLWNTRTIRDSGLAMLLMLGRRAEMLLNPIRLVNCRPDIRDRLRESRVGAQFQISLSTVRARGPGSGLASCWG